MSPGFETPTACGERSLSKVSPARRHRVSLSVHTGPDTDEFGTPSHLLFPSTPETTAVSLYSNAFLGGTPVARQCEMTSDSFLGRSRTTTEEAPFFKQHTGTDGSAAAKKRATQQGLRSKPNKTDAIHITKSFTWTDKGTKGTFPAASVDALKRGTHFLSRVQHPSDLTDVDISHNQISDIEVGLMLMTIPALQKLNLAGNLITSLASIVPLGVLPHLEELDIRDNPCCPEPAAVAGRSKILTTLLAPEVSREAHIISAAEAAVATAASGPVARARLELLQTSHSMQAASEGSEQRRRVKHGASMLSPPGRKPAMRLASSGSAPALLGQVTPQSPIQSRAYRSHHMQGSEAVTMAEEAARNHLQELRRSSCSGECSPAKELANTSDFWALDRTIEEAKWEARHDQDIKRRVKGSFPRTHLYHAVVGSCYENSECGEDQCAPSWGAGTKDWFPKLLVLNGAMVTVQDLEDVAAYADDMAASFQTSTIRGSAEGESSTKTSVLNLRMEKGETHHEFLIRFRGAFVKYHRQKQLSRPMHFSKDYECWRKKQEAKELKLRQREAKRQQEAKLHEGRQSGGSDCDDIDCESDDYVFEHSRSDNSSSKSPTKAVLQSPGNSSSTRVPSSALTPFTDAESQIDSFSRADSPRARGRKDSSTSTEEQLAQMMETDLWELQRQTLRHLEAGGMITDPNDCGSSADDLDEAPEWLTQLHYETEIRRPQSASQPRSTKTSYDFMQTHVPCQSLTTKKQGGKLQRTYGAVSAGNLSSAVKAVMSGTVVAFETEVESGVDALAGSVQDADRAKCLARLRSLGLAPSSGNSAAQGIACDQWMRQLKEDYPDKFSKTELAPISFGNARPARKREVDTESREQAIIKSNLFILDLNGDPTSENEWQPRQVWLSRKGRIWLGDPHNPKHRPSLYLGGHCVSDVQFSPVGSNDAVARINGAPVYVLRIDFPGARFTRKKYFATSSVETRDAWIRICSSHTPAKNG